jgi:type II secretion system protein C
MVRKDGSMKSLFSREHIRYLIIALLLMLAIKLAWFTISWSVLSPEGVEYRSKAGQKQLTSVGSFAPRAKPVRSVVAPKAADIKSIKLQAIYRSSAILVITVTKNSESHVLSRGDQIDGYELEDATPKEAIFVKDGKHYRVELVDDALSGGAEGRVTYVSPKPDETVQPDPPSQEEGVIQSDAGYAVVSRKLLEHYTKDPQNLQDIWRDIGIKEVEKEGLITGFRVNFVRRGSDFAKLGLRRGDVILAINGEVLDSYQKAFDAYKNIHTVSDVMLSIQRGDQKMELEYEIR